MSRRWIVAGLLLLAGAVPGTAGAQEEEPPVSVAEGATLKLEVLAQPQASTTTVDSALDSDFELRRGVESPLSGCKPRPLGEGNE